MQTDEPLSSLTINLILQRWLNNFDCNCTEVKNALKYREQDTEKVDVTAVVWLSADCKEERKS